MFLLAAVSMLLYLTGCQTELPPSGDSDNSNDITQQLRNQEHVTGGLHPFELIENPEYAPVHEIDYLKDSDMVFLTRASGYVSL